MSSSLVDVSILSSCLARLFLPFLAVAGLSMALGLALSGHTVRVLEKSPRLENVPGGIRLTPNVTKILVQWGLGDELRKRGTLVREGSHLWDCKLL
jgi:salicylate hydroxylase